MSLNKTCLEAQIVCALDTDTGLESGNVSNFAFASFAIDKLCDDRKMTVATFNDLPAANTVPPGQIIHVEEYNVPLVNANGIWKGLDGRIPGIVVSRLLTWGRNLGGPLGDGSTTNNCFPSTTLGGGTNWSIVDTSSYSSFGIKSDGTLWAWGCNGNGRLGDGSSINRLSPVTVAGGGTTWCQLGSGANQGLAIKTDGTMWTWGTASLGALGDGTTINRCSPGTTDGGGTDWCQGSMGSFGGAAVKQDSTLWTWGGGAGGKNGDGSTTNRCSPGTIAGGGTDWCHVTRAGDLAFALKTDCTLWTWGCNFQGALGIGSNVNQSSPVTTADGGSNWCQVSGLLNAGHAIKTDGTLWTWGFNCAGRLGNGNQTARCSPGTISGGGTDWCKVGSRGQHGVAVKTDGTLWTWGCNGGGALGDCTTTNRLSPVTTTGGGTNWCMGVGGVSHTIGLTNVQ